MEHRVYVLLTARLNISNSILLKSVNCCYCYCSATNGIFRSAESRDLLATKPDRKLLGVLPAPGEGGYSLYSDDRDDRRIF